MPNTVSNNRTVSESQLTVNTYVLVRGNIEFARLLNKIEGEELVKDQRRKMQMGMSPIDKPYTTVTLTNARIVPIKPGFKSPEETFVEERFYKRQGDPADAPFHYTINNGAEQTIAKNTSGAYDITVKKGDVVQLYSLNSSLGGSAVAGARGTTRAVDSGAKYINIRPSMKTEIYGNVMSLLKGKDNLESATTIEANNAFYGLFAGADKLVNNTERLLVLPATTLTEGCYDNMFSGCKGIEKAPELPAPKLEKGCYQEMFYDCAKLNHVKCLATDIKAENSTKDWLGKAGTEATGEKVLESAVPMTANSDDGVPTAWTAAIVVTSVTLDKTELALTVGDAAVQLKATVAPDNATDKTVTWSIDKTSVATVDATGKVTAVAEGTATITAKAGDKTATCKVTVTAPAPAPGMNAIDPFGKGDDPFGGSN